MSRFVDILALDLATRLGWARCQGWGWEQPLSGWVQLPSAEDGDFGRMALEYRAWLRGYIVISGRPDWIYIERPIVNEHAGQNAAWITIGLAWETMAVCKERGIFCRLTASSTARKSLTGKGNAKKDDVGFALRQRGRQVWEHNEADALCLMDHARHERYPRHESQLLAGARA